MFNFFKKTKSNSVEMEEAGLLSAIWILASNDENPIMTYKSICYRLDLPDSYNIKGLIKKRSELFRPGVPSWRLKEWKEKMLSGISIPAWVKEIKDEKEKEETIKSLTPDDVFRSQFRARKETTKSPIELIDWGLQHIDRLRKAKVEEKEISWKWLKEGVIPILSILIALTAIVASWWIQSDNIYSQEELKKYELDTQERLKKYELSFNQRNNSYVLIMQAFESAFKSAESRDRAGLQTNLEQLELSYYKIRPFLRKEAQLKFSETFSNYSKHLNDLLDKGLSKEILVKEQEPYKTFKDYFGELLYQELFEKSNYVNTPVLYPVK